MTAVSMAQYARGSQSDQALLCYSCGAECEFHDSSGTDPRLSRSEWLRQEYDREDAHWINRAFGRRDLLPRRKCAEEPAMVQQALRICAGRTLSLHSPYRTRISPAR